MTSAPDGAEPHTLKTTLPLELSSEVVGLSLLAAGFGLTVFVTVTVGCGFPAALPGAVVVTVTVGCGTVPAAVFSPPLPEDPMPTPMSRMTSAAGIAMRFLAHFGFPNGAGGVGAKGG
ncbi:hypothetical protein [Streptomyces sp. ID05-04B]|uniref:hypothetical protein n=1 Tax=Streptomyces sp. ID05-04B TaxID=3028661 RepID=UPI0029C9CEE8|nr:hypothetical protein [Streptomyces sp. ID05-04B]